MSNHPSIPNRNQGPKGIPFGMGFDDALRPPLSTPVHNGSSMANVFDPTEKLKETEKPKKKKNDAAKSPEKADQPEAPTPNGKAQ